MGVGGRGKEKEASEGVGCSGQPQARRHLGALYGTPPQSGCAPPPWPRDAPTVKRRPGRAATPPQRREARGEGAPTGSAADVMAGGPPPAPAPHPTPCPRAAGQLFAPPPSPPPPPVSQKQTAVYRSMGKGRAPPKSGMLGVLHAPIAPLPIKRPVRDGWMCPALPCLYTSHGGRETLCARGYPRGGEREVSRQLFFGQSRPRIPRFMTSPLKPIFITKR